jgi:hypothetical protein
LASVQGTCETAAYIFSACIFIGQSLTFARLLLSRRFLIGRKEKKEKKGKKGRKRESAAFRGERDDPDNGIPVYKSEILIVVIPL